MTRRSLVPLAVTAGVAAASTLLLVLAVRGGWLGADVGRGATFCEAARAGWVRQPGNTFSNAGFVIAGLAVAWRAGRPDLLGDVLPRRPGTATAWACVVVLLGPASAAMHATQSARGGDLDLFSMYLTSSFAAAYALTRWWERNRVFAAQLFSLLVAACVLVGSVGGDDVPVVRYAGNVAFAVLLVTTVVLEVRLHRRGPTRTDLRWGAAALGSMAVAFVVWNLGQHGLCDPRSLVQAHGLWHLLGALAAWLLFRLWASEVEPAATVAA